MDISKTYKGFFWIPSEPNNQKCGVLKFLNGTAYVDLFGSFDKDPFNVKSGRRKNICHVHGLLENGRCCILDTCSLSLTGGLGGIIGTLINFKSFIYSSNRDLLKKRVYFNKIEFNINTLFHWGGENSIESYRNENNELSLKYVKPSDRTIIFTGERYDLILNHFTSIPLTTYKKKLSIEQDTSLVLHSKYQNLDLTEELEYINHIHDFFILLNSDKVVLKNQFILYTQNSDDYFYYYSNQVRFRNSSGFQSHEFGNLFTLGDLEDIANIQEVFSLWFSLYAQHDYTIELLVQSLSGIQLNRQNRFMNLVYALEHLCSNDLVALKAEKFYSKKSKEILTELERLIPENADLNRKNFFEKLRARLESHRKLSDKFEAYFSQQSIPIEELFNDQPDEFIQRIVNTRNHFAHVSDKEPRIEIEDIYHYNLKLEAVLIYLILEKIKIPRESIVLKLKSHDKFQKVVS